MQRQTYVVHGRLAAREIRLEAARAGKHGIQIMSFEQLAARLAGGFVSGIEPDALRDAIQAAVSPATPEPTTATRRCPVVIMRGPRGVVRGSAAEEKNVVGCSCRLGEVEERDRVGGGLR